MNITNRARKVDEKMMPFVWFPFFLPELWSLNFPKFSLHLFLQICADLSKKSKSIVAIYLDLSERPHQALSESSMFYRGLANGSWDIEE